MRTRIVTLAALPLLLTVLPAPAYTPPGRTIRLSVSATGEEFERTSSAPAVSADGSAVAFWSDAPLVPDDTNGLQDVYVRDMAAGTIERVSVSSSGAQATTSTLTSKTVPAISGDGRLVAFENGSGELVPGDTNGVDDVFVHDRATGVTSRVSVSPGGTQAAWHSLAPELSSDGRYVFFMSEDDTLVPGDESPYIDIFRRDLQTNAMEIVSRSSDGRQAVIDPSSFSINASGTIVAWAAKSITYDVPDANAVIDDVYVRDLVAGTTERISAAPAGAPADHASLDPAVSGDGRYVAFSSLADNLVPGDTNGWVDVFVHDRVTGRTERASVSSAGEQTSQGGGSPAISRDGRYLVFNGVNADLSDDPDGNGGTDVYLHDLLTGSTSLVSVKANGTGSGDAISYGPTASEGGRLVAFQTRASDIVPGDENYHLDVFARNRGAANSVADLQVDRGSGGAIVSGWARFDGGVSQATDPTGDATAQAQALGGELVGARIAHRPEEDDLYVRLDLALLPHAPKTGQVGVQGIVYTATFNVKSVKYELRAPVVAGSPVTIAIRKCAPACTQIGTARGGLGVVGAALTASVPLSLLDLDPNAKLLSPYVSTSYSGGVSTTGDSVSLPELQVGAPRVEVGVAPAGIPAEDVAFVPAQSLANGRFGADLGALAAGPNDVWARTCLGSACSSPASVRV